MVMEMVNFPQQFLRLTGDLNQLRNHVHVGLGVWREGREGGETSRVALPARQNFILHHHSLQVVLRCEDGGSIYIITIGRETG